MGGVRHKALPDGPTGQPDAVWLWALMLKDFDLCQISFSRKWKPFV